MHVQYDIVVLSWLFILGLLIGYARHRTGSIWVPIAMHAFNNAMASLEIIHLMDT
ncbi:MAG: CPBP family intramembrane metalloprotease [Akkermansiaceae bacterium]|nr:CPBP family intramembrane metalloprotease [Akkermansiaceae bacterium]